MPRQVEHVLGRSAAQARLQARREQRRRESLARDVGQGQAHAAGPELEEVVVVTSNGPSLDTARRALERDESGRPLGQQLGLDLPRQVHLVLRPPLHLETLRHLLGEADALEGDPRLDRDRRQELLVLAGIGILREPRAEEQQAGHPTVAPQDRNQAVGLQRRQRTERLAAGGAGGRGRPRVCRAAPDRRGSTARPQASRIPRARFRERA